MKFVMPNDGSRTSSSDAAKALVSEGKRATAMLRGKVVRKVVRNRAGEVAIEFDDGARLFVESHGELELSIT